MKQMILKIRFIRHDELDGYMEIEDNLELMKDENINYFHKLERKNIKLLEQIKKLINK